MGYLPRAAHTVNLFCLLLLLGCDAPDKVAPSEAAPTASPPKPSPSVSSAPQPSAKARPVSIAPSDPMKAYTPKVVAKFDAPGACLAICASGLRCRSPAVFGAGNRVGAHKRYLGCREACLNGANVAKPNYVADAKACLTSGSCEAFNACVESVLPINR